MSDTWVCPETDCGRTVIEPDISVRRLAIASHMKSHGKQSDGLPLKNEKPGKGSSRSRNVAETVGDVVGDVVEGVLGGIGRIFD